MTRKQIPVSQLKRSGIRHETLLLSHRGQKKQTLQPAALLT
jgi:hypothetical protein